MATSFKNGVSAGIGTSETTILTGGSGKQTTVIGLSIANITGSAITVDVKVTDTSASVTGFIVKGATISPGASLVAIGGDQKVVIEASDLLKVTSSASSSADAIVSFLEVS